MAERVERVDGLDGLSLEDDGSISTSSHQTSIPDQLPTSGQFDHPFMETRPSRYMQLQHRRWLQAHRRQRAARRAERPDSGIYSLPRNLSDLEPIEPIESNGSGITSMDIDKQSTNRSAYQSTVSSIPPPSSTPQQFPYAVDDSVNWDARPGHLASEPTPGSPTGTAGPSTAQPQATHEVSQVSSRNQTLEPEAGEVYDEQKMEMEADEGFGEETYTIPKNIDENLGRDLVAHYRSLGLLPFRSSADAAKRSSVLVPRAPRMRKRDKRQSRLRHAAEGARLAAGNQSENTAPIQRPLDGVLSDGSSTGLHHCQQTHGQGGGL